MLRFLCLTTLAVMAWSSPGLAQVSSQDIITGIEREIIERYYKPATQDGDKSKKKNKNKDKGSGELPPGLAKKDQLPPGLAKRSELPPGLAKRDLPDDLLSQLPRRKGEEFVLVDDNVVLVEQATGVVLDILTGAAGQGHK